MDSCVYHSGEVKIFPTIAANSGYWHFEVHKFEHLPHIRKRTNLKEYSSDCEAPLLRSGLL